MISVCTCSHSIEQHGICAMSCQVCMCDCFRGAKRLPKSCRYPLRTPVTSPRSFYDVALVLGGIDNTIRELLEKEAS
jgi:hypothetical protein